MQNARNGNHPLSEKEKQAFLALLDSRAPVEGTKVVAIYDCALSTLQAVAHWTAEKIIKFAFVSLLLPHVRSPALNTSYSPLSLDGKEKRTAFIRIEVDKEPTHAIPVYPRSV